MDMGERMVQVETALEISRDTGESKRLARQDKRLSALEKWHWMVLGACGVIEALHALRDMGLLPK